jgi:hypothetical protein
MQTLIAIQAKLLPPKKNKKYRKYRQQQAVEAPLESNK